MPGKHAPESPASFILSVGRAAAGALVVLGVVAVIAVAATGSNKKPTAQSSTPRATISTRTPTSSPSATLPTTPTPTATASTAQKVTVNVFNGTTRNGLAGALATKLRAEGYAVKTVATEPKHQTVTTIYYRPGQKAAADALLAAHPELGRVAAAIATTPTNASLTIILGDDYKAA